MGLQWATLKWIILNLDFISHFILKYGSKFRDMAGTQVEFNTMKIVWVK